MGQSGGLQHPLVSILLSSEGFVSEFDVKPVAYSDADWYSFVRARPCMGEGCCIIDEDA